MRFPYFQISLTDFAPIIPLGIKGKEDWLEFEAYIDSGASFSIFNIDRAELLEIDYTTGRKIHLTLGDGGLIEVYIHQREVELAGERFVADIGFSRQLGVAFNLLGRKSFFEHFRICFDDKRRFVDLTPIQNRL